jgi:hypothetical protein
MTMPEMKSIKDIFPIIIEKYERFIPNIEGMGMPDKINAIIQYLNRIGKINNDVVENWNVVMKWVLDDGLEDAVIAKVDDLIANGTFEDLLNGMFDVINADVTDFKTTINTQLADMSTYVYLESYKKQDAETDDTNRIQRAIDSFGVNGGILKLTKSVTLSSSIQLPENVSLEGTGHGLSNTIITYNGTGFAIKTKGQHTRSNIKNIRINLNGTNDGILIGDAYANLNGYVPGINQLSNVTIASIGVGKVGLKLLNVSHCSLDNVHIGYGTTTGGTGLKIESDTLNTGVISANNCVFGRVDNTDIGLVIDGNAALDSFSFNACYFGGKTTTVQLGQSASGVVRNAVFNGCHYECRNVSGNGIEIYNVRGGGINGGSIQGYGTLVNGITFKSGTTTRRFNVFGVEGNSISTNFYNNEGATTLEDCILQACVKTGSTVTNQFNGTFTACQRFDETKFRLDNIVPENIYLGGRKHTYGTAAPTTGTYNQGDVVYNTTPTASGYMGWTCVISGTPGTWKGFGLIQS